MNDEIKIKGSEQINISCTKNILNQMINCICKIKIKKNNKAKIVIMKQKLLMSLFMVLHFFVK